MSFSKEIKQLEERGCNFQYLKVGDKQSIVLNPIPKDWVGNFEVPNGVTLMKDEVFSQCNNLTKVTISSNINSIGYGAFRYSKNLAEVNIPSSVDIIQDWAFAGCEKLNKISLGEGIRDICRGAFEDCKSLEKITLPNTVVSIDKTIFKGCDNLKEVTAPPSIAILLRKEYPSVKLNISDSMSLDGLIQNHKDTLRGGPEAHDVQKSDHGLDL